MRESDEARPAPEAEPVELLSGWNLNHVQFVRGSGKAEIGYLDAEDDRFFPIVTVDTGLYYRPQDAVPLARAILDRLAAAPEVRQVEPSPEALSADERSLLKSLRATFEELQGHDEWCASVASDAMAQIDAAMGAAPSKDERSLDARDALMLAAQDYVALLDLIRSSPQPPHGDYWHQAMHEKEQALRTSILAAMGAAPSGAGGTK